MSGSEDTANDSGDVVMVTKETDLELFASVSRWPRNLPIEVLLMVFMLLDKNHLKSLRCVGKFFERLISPLLFNTIHISPHSPNLDVFRQITEHSDLCRYPRVLVYDVQRFKANIDPREYYKELCHQLHSLRTDGSHSDIHQVDTEIEGFMRRARNRPDEYEGYSNCRVFRRGFESYRAKAEEKDHYNSSGQLLALLCIGLLKLPSLDMVEFKSRWENWHLRSVDMSKSLRGLRMFSSPLARAWSPFHLKPKAPSNQANTVHEFDNVISAFSLTKRRLRVLEAGCLNIVPYEKFYTKSPLSRTFREHSLAAMYSLERLTLHIDRKRYSAEEGLSNPGHVFPEEKTLSVDLLAAALLRMPGLKHLSLTGEIRRDGDGLISISELFQTVRLPTLEVLSLQAMLGSAADIIAFLRAQPLLRYLEIREIELSEGTWAGLVDDMRRWLHLESVFFELPLRQGGGADIWDENLWGDVCDEINNYLVFGGKNPLRMTE